MSRPQYWCRNQRRREVVRAAGALNGIEYLEVHEDQVHLDVHFLQDLPGSGPQAVPQGAPPLDADNVVITGGERVRDITVLTAGTAGRVLTVAVDRAGDFSPYELRLVDPAAGDAVPSGFDTQLGAIVFSFKAGCHSDLDCLQPEPCPEHLRAEPLLDYLAKDYDSLRRLMLDRLATTVPGVVDPHAADVVTMLVELLAYAGDRLSYFQDAVATEAYLGTARSRVSVRRHARLLDYHVHDGASARTFLQFTVTADQTLPRGTAVRAAGPKPPHRAPVVFETAHELVAKTAANRLAFHTWSDEQCCLPAGATRATLAGGPEVGLAPGAFLLLEEILDPQTRAAPDPAHRQVVRLVAVTPTTDRLVGRPVLKIEWGRNDALSFPLCISVEGAVTAVASGNVAVADHGETRHAGVLPAETPAPAGRWRPQVPETPLAFVVPYGSSAARTPAADLLVVDPRQARAAILLDDGDLRWGPAPDLLVGAGPTSPSFVVEVEDDGTTRLRFGDGTSGRRPADGQRFAATYRIGGGPAGNVASDTLSTLVVATSGVAGVRNPLAAVGGARAEPIEQARQLAPQAFRRQERAVIAADYAAVADRFDDVQRAVASFRWSGSWRTATVTVDRAGGGSPHDDDLADRMRDFLDTYRMAGVDIEIDSPVPVPVELALTIGVAAGHMAADVQRDVGNALSSRRLGDGRRGFFHPDNLTFGRPVYLSQIYAAVLAVPGVEWVTATAFQRYGQTGGDELTEGVLRVEGREIPLLDRDSRSLERGQLVLTTVGGL